MRFFKIFSLHFEGIFEHRFRSFVWFLIPVVNILPIILFWTLALKTNRHIEWSIQSLNTYYLVLIIAMSMLTSHVEEDVSEVDIMQGDLARYLLKPFSYYWVKFFEETPYRVLQGFYGIILFVLMSLFFRNFFQVSFNISLFFFGIISAFLAYFISFTFKIIIGYTAFWFTDNRAITETLMILSIIFAGQIVPLDLFPDSLKNIALALPFAAMIYYPVIILLGKLSLFETLKVILIQIFWLILFLILEKLVWRKGIKKFTAIGQ